MSWKIWPENPALSALTLFLVAIPFLYAARAPIHGVVESLAAALSNALRLGARSLLAMARELRSRNRLVLLAQGREEIAQTVEREFQRVTALVDAVYPQAVRTELFQGLAHVSDANHR